MSTGARDTLDHLDQVVALKGSMKSVPLTGAPGFWISKRKGRIFLTKRTVKGILGLPVSGGSDPQVDED